MKSIAQAGYGGMGAGFAVVGIGAGAAAAVVAVGIATSNRSSSDVYISSGYYYCRKHRVPVRVVNGGLWCPVEGRFLTAPRG